MANRFEGDADPTSAADSTDPTDSTAPSATPVGPPTDRELPADPETETPPGRLRLLGIALALIAIGFCIWAVAQDWTEVSRALSDANLTTLAVAFVLSAMSMLFLAVLWQRCLTTMNTSVPLHEVVGWYFIGELGKYLPGGVWQVIGRGEIAHRTRGISRTVSYISTLISYAAMCLGALLLCAAMAPFMATGENGSSLAWLFLPALVLVPMLIHPSVAAAVIKTVSKVTKRKIDFVPLPWSTMFGLVLWSIPAWLFLGAASVAVTASLGYHVHPVRVALAAVAAWVVGFLAVPVPAGAGIREVTFAALSGLPAGPAVAVAVVARAMFIVVDAAGGIIALMVRAFAQRRRTKR